jgi:hypothetical protein
MVNRKSSKFCPHSAFMYYVGTYLCVYIYMCIYIYPSQFIQKRKAKHSSSLTTQYLQLNFSLHNKYRTSSTALIISSGTILLNNKYVRIKMASCFNFEILITQQHSSSRCFKYSTQRWPEVWYLSYRLQCNCK